MEPEMLKLRRTASKVLLVVAVVLGGQAVATPAHATITEVNFSASVEWMKFPEVCRSGLGCDASSGPVVRLWQFIVFVHFGPKQIGQSCEAFVDGQFGPNTETWTKKWQAEVMGASAADGRAGPNTWGTAWFKLTTDGWVTADQGYTASGDYTYTDTHGKFYLDWNGHYYPYPVGWYGTWHFWACSRATL
jgi:hypothetical protein